MTVRQYFAALQRRWYVLACLLACVAVALALIPRHTEVYWTRVDVVFLPPANPDIPTNVLETSDQSVIYFAAAVERQVSGGAEQVVLASPDATLYGAGVRRGFSIRLFNSGGQWVSNFNRPLLSVQVVESSAAAAQQLAARVVGEIQSTARREQAATGARAVYHIATELSPQQPVVTQVGGRPLRATLALLVLGVLAAAALTVRVDRALARESSPAVRTTRAQVTSPGGAGGDG